MVLDSNHFYAKIISLCKCLSDQVHVTVAFPSSSESNSSWHMSTLSFMLRQAVELLMVASEALSLSRHSFLWCNLWVRSQMEGKLNGILSRDSYCWLALLQKVAPVHSRSARPPDLAARHIATSVGVTTNIDMCRATCTIFFCLFAFLLFA